MKKRLKKGYYLDSKIDENEFNKSGCGLYGFVAGTEDYEKYKKGELVPIKYGQYGTTAENGKTPLETVISYQKTTSYDTIFVYHRPLNNLNGITPLQVENRLKKIFKKNKKTRGTSEEIFEVKTDVYDSEVDRVIESLTGCKSNGYDSLKTPFWYQKLFKHILLEFFNKTNIFLLALDCGKGKSLLISHFISSVFDKINGDIFLLTTKPSTLEQYANEDKKTGYFYSKEIMGKYHICYLNDEVNSGNFNYESIKKEAGSKKIIFVTSKQFLDKSFNEKFKKFNDDFKETMKEKISLIVSDESHWGANTLITDKILNNFNEDVKILYSTATPGSLLYKYNIDKKYQLYINNEIERKLYSFERNKTNENFELFLTDISNGDETLKKSIKDYYNNELRLDMNIDLVKFMESRLVSPVFINTSIDKSIKEKLDMEEYGYDIGKLYMIDNDGVRRIHELSVVYFLKKIFEPKIINIPNLAPRKSRSNFEKIVHKYCEKGNRNIIKKGHTIVFRIYAGQGDHKLNGNIEYIKKCVLGVEYLKDNYEIMTIPTDFNGSVREKCIERYEEARIRNKNLIILYGEKIDVGVDFPEINPDVFINLSKLGSIDNGIQILGRFSRGNENGDKKFYFIFDINISSTLTCFYQSRTNNKTEGIYNFLYRYKEDIFDISNSELVESDDNYISELKTNVINSLNYYNNSESLYELISNGNIIDDIYYNENTKKFNFSDSRNEDLSGKLKESSKVKKDDVDGGNNGDNSSNDDSDDNYIKKEIRSKLGYKHILPEIIKVYRDMIGESCNNLREILDTILKKEEYNSQLLVYLSKLMTNLKINTNGQDTLKVINYIINNIDCNKLNNELIYRDIIKPIDMLKINIYQNFIDLKNEIEKKPNYFSYSNSASEIDVPFWLGEEMLSRIKININDKVLFPSTKYGMFPFLSLCNIIGEDKVYQIFDIDHVIRLLSSNFVLCDTNDNHLFICNIFGKQRSGYQSKIITEFYNSVELIYSRCSDEYQDIFDSLILSLFSKNNMNNFHIIEDKIKEFMSSDNFNKWLNNCKETISKYIETSKLCSKEFGEVFTPEWLIREMISLLPKAKKTDIFLDPAAGIGNFSIILVEKLMGDLKEEIINEDDRKKHILENMIVQCELQVKNAFVNYYILDKESKYDLKIFRGSFLSNDLKSVNPEFLKKCKEWGIEKFDFAIGNPPYQIQVGPKKSHPLWDKFIINLDKVLNENGHFILVHPSGWRSPSGVFRDVYNLYINYDILYLNLNDFNKGSETFGVGTNYDFYVIRKSKTESLKTEVVDIDDIKYNIDLKNSVFIPNGKFDIFNNLISNDKCNKVDILYSRSAYGTDKKNISKNKCDMFKNPVVYTITQRDGVNLMYSNTIDNGHFNVPKVIWSNGLGTYPIVDSKGEYGLTQFSYGIVDSIDNLENIKLVMESKEFIDLMSYNRFTNHKYDYKVISTFRKDFWKEFI